MDALRDNWQEQGFIIIRQLYSPDRVLWLRAACERILTQWRGENPAERRGDATSMRHLNHPDYWREDSEGLRRMLEAIADPAVLQTCNELFGAPPLFRCTSLFMNPETGMLDGDWHRDSQFLFPDEEVERKKILESIGVSDHIQLQIALVASDDIEYVPGSHRRWDSPEEYAIRRENSGENRRNSMPNALRVALQPGDAVGFNAYGLHRGRYHSNRLRRTFMLTFTDSRKPLADYFSHQPWFRSPRYLDGLNDAQRRFFEEFIATYSESWE